MAERQVCGHSALCVAGQGKARLNGQEIEPHNKTLLCFDKGEGERERHLTPFAAEWTSVDSPI